MAIEGSLQDVALPDICQLLSMGMKTGCLSLTDRSNFGYIYFAKGRVTHASVLNRPDRLGELLVRNGIISRADLSAAMQAQGHEKGQRLGELLVRRGALTQEQLQRFISLQIEEAVYHLFTWNQGSFHFDPDQAPDPGLFLVNINADALLMEGARRVDEWSLIEKKIPSMDLVFAVVKQPPADVELTKQEQKLLPLIDGHRTVEEIVLECGMVEFEAAKALFGLIQPGFVERAGQRDAASSGPGTDDQDVAQHLSLGVAFYRSGMMEDAIREFQEVLDKEPKHARALFRLGLIAFRSGKLQDAIDYFDRMPESARNTYSVLRNRALALEHLFRYPEALEALDQAEKVRPEDPQIALARGIVKLKAGDVPGAMAALRAYRTAPTLRKPSALYYAYTTLAASMAGEVDYAVAVGREGLTHYATCGPLLVNAGAVLERKGEAEAAEALYARAVQNAPVPAQAHKNLGDQAWGRGDQTAARVHYEKAVKIEPRLGDDIYLRLGNIAFKDQDFDVARLLWRRALELNPQNAVVRANLESLS
jgi:tetratricopeptide (TPR) repeat protein